ncbi:hypothetical protein [uncultured Phascolarctobacterium sp.]|uniref:hypothetical protein n=1 Tax=uncultured Phascolarctobacterium sp. TaxID=512296 RepID=UPI0027D93369|nr:hypothetical protein [uncultured Phascolarctobacterium sp.]
MKKSVLAVVMLLALAVSSVCMAAGDGNDLNREQRVVDKFVAALEAPAGSGFAQVQGDLAPGLQSKLTAEGFAELQKQLREKFGKQKEVKFASFERFDQADRLLYLMGYSRQQVVRAAYVFDKDGKLAEFVFVPVEVQEEQK